MGLEVLTGGRSPYLAFMFTPRFRRFLPWADFGASDEAEVSRHEAAQWRETFLRFLRKLSHRAGGAEGAPRPLLLKSPAHTARVKTLLE
jgi:hypothetical protein